MRIITSSRSHSNDKLDLLEMEHHALKKYGGKYETKTAEGQYRLCLKYLKEEEGQDSISALYWLKISAKNGYAPAQHLLGSLYFRKQGLKKLKKSYKWTYLASQQSHPLAIETLEEIKKVLYQKSREEIHSLLCVNKR